MGEGILSQGLDQPLHSRPPFPPSCSFIILSNILSIFILFVFIVLIVFIIVPAVSIVPTVHLVQVRVYRPGIKLVSAEKAPMRCATCHRAGDMVTPSRLLGHGPAAWARLDLCQRLVRPFSCHLLAVVADPVSPLGWSPRRADALHQALGEPALQAPPVNPRSSLLHCRLKIANCVDPHPVSSQRRRRWCSATEGTGQRGRVDDSPSGIESIPPFRAISANALVATSTATC